MQTMPLAKLELTEYLSEYDSFVLFDGLDEVGEERRGDCVLQIISFSREYPRARTIVTTRIHGYHPGSPHPERFRDAQFQQFTLQDFNDSDIHQFIDLWHKEAFTNP